MSRVGTEGLGDLELESVNPSREGSVGFEGVAPTEVGMVDTDSQASAAERRHERADNQVVVEQTAVVASPKVDIEKSFRSPMDIQQEAIMTALMNELADQIMVGGVV